MYRSRSSKRLHRCPIGQGSLQVPWNSMPCFQVFSAHYLVAAFPWGSSGDLTVVDAGSGLGHVSRALMEHSPTVKCIFEDSPDIFMQGQDGLAADLHGRISFKAHDLFRKQPTKGADVYFLRLVQRVFKNDHPGLDPRTQTRRIDCDQRPCNSRTRRGVLFGRVGSTVCPRMRVHCTQD